jgi:NAD(P)-dependent dehydrogenase (short-subunit alcohol dehydrogenase family)
MTIAIRENLQTTQPLLGKVSLVTGSTSGIGLGIARALAGAGASVVLNGFGKPEEIAQTKAQLASEFNVAASYSGADMSKPDSIREMIEETLGSFGRLDILVNNAGLTFTYIDPDRFRRDGPRKFWAVGDDVVQTVMDTNYVAADQMTRRVAAILVQQGWGRIVNVTTKLDTMNMVGSIPYGSSKAALEMASEVWAKEIAATGVTVNIVNPGAGANTPGMNQEMRDWSRDGLKPRLVEPDQMVPPLLYVVSTAADRVNGYRFDALTWDVTAPPAEAARRNGRPVGFVLHPQDQATFPAG